MHGQQNIKKVITSLFQIFYWKSLPNFMLCNPYSWQPAIQ